MTFRALSIISALTIFVGGCTGGGADTDTAIPRRTAYPRPALLDTAMTTVADLPVSFAVNAGATISRPQTNWLDVFYPTYGATMHVSFTAVDSTTIDDVMANRFERIALNNGNVLATTSHEDINAAGFDYLTVRLDGTATPLQFLATDLESIVVSGVVYMSDPKVATAIDSLRPIVDAIEADINRAMLSLR